MERLDERVAHGAPLRVKRARRRVAAGWPVEQAARLRAEVVEGLDDIEQGDLSRVPSQAKASAAASPALEQPFSHERLQDFSEKGGRHTRRVCDRPA
jgi:hypothetical protein